MFRAGKLILHFLLRTGLHQFPGTWDAVINQADVSSHWDFFFFFSREAKVSALRSGLTHTWFDKQREDGVFLGEETLQDSNYFHTNILSLPPPVAIQPYLPVSLDGSGHWLFYFMLFVWGFFFALSIVVQEDFPTTEFPWAFFSADVCFKEEKRTKALYFWAFDTVFAFQNFSWLNHRFYKSKICFVLERT